MIRPRASVTISFKSLQPLTELWRKGTGGGGDTVLRTVTEKWTAVIAVTGNHLNTKLNDCSTVIEWPRIICVLHRRLEDTRPVNGRPSVIISAK